MAVLVEFIYFIGWQVRRTAGFAQEGDKLIAIESLKAVVGREPDKTLPVLNNVVDNVGGKPFAEAIMRKAVLLRMLAVPLKGNKA